MQGTTGVIPIVMNIEKPRQDVGAFSYVCTPFWAIAKFKNNPHIQFYS